MFYVAPTNTVHFTLLFTDTVESSCTTSFKNVLAREAHEHSSVKCSFSSFTRTATRLSRDFPRASCLAIAGFGLNERNVLHYKHVNVHCSFTVC